jgi:alkylation response protein AidB-like acyl-CoA dehydrogenase
MAGLDQADLAALRETVRGVCARKWPTATTAASTDLGELWEAAAHQGWTDLGGIEQVQAAVAVQEELGRFACPLPIVDAAIVVTLAQDRGDDVLAAAVASGVVRPAVGWSRQGMDSELVVRHVEAGPVLTHVVVVDEDAGTLAWHGVDPEAVTQLAGLAVPAWSEIRLAGAPEWTVPLDGYRDLLVVRRLGLAARAVAAGRRTHELAVEHACLREQFGKPIGSFQAVSHRLVRVECALTAAAYLQSHVWELLAAQDQTWWLAAEIYLEFVTSRMANLQFDGQHTLAAIGYFEEHEAPWLFRRVHADLAALAAAPAEMSVGEALVDAGARLPEFNLGPDAEQVRREVLEAFESWRDAPPSHLGSSDDDARAVLRDRGWLGVGWPTELGGGGYDVATLLAFSEAVAYASPPVGNIWMAIDSIAPMLIKVGPPELRDLVMTEARSGALSIALGYSEPGAGSDLASLRTSAEKVDGGWRVNGQKLWGTCVPDSKWMVLAARTDADVVPHAGISLFLVDVDSPGITVAEHRSLGGEISATTFWDDVFVPDDRLVGEAGQGWAALRAALAHERVLIGASVMKVRRELDRLVETAAKEPAAVLPGRRRDLRSEIGRLAVELQAARSLVNAAVRETTTGSGGTAVAPMAKVIATELAEDLNATAVALLGPDALYEHGVPDAVGDGYFEDGLRASIMGVIAGGTSDIQRNLIARSMGLPR